MTCSRLAVHRVGQISKQQQRRLADVVLTCILLIKEVLLPYCCHTTRLYFRQNVDLAIEEGEEKQ